MYPYSLIVCGCTKNSSNYIKKNLELLYDIQPLFKEFKLLVFENDSVDSTGKILQLFKSTHPLFDFISETNNILKRTEAIAHGRNTLLQYAQNHNYDYMIMVDLDDVISTFKSSQIKYLFEKDEWDALFANCIGKYYDVWALRIDQTIWNSSNPFKMIDFDCWEMAKRCQTNRCVSAYQIVIPINAPLIPVTSAFGGFGIYKVNKTQGCSYNGDTCEHVSFHKEMIEKNKAKLFICPKFLVNKQDVHIIKNV